MEKKLSKKALSKSFHNWYYGHLTCFSQEHMQTFGYLCSMLPLVEELYDNEEDKAKAMDTYTAFFNTEPQLGSVIVGMTAGLEEARANGAEDVDEETINGLRAGLMGPIAGIGDSLVVGTVIPILLGIAMGMSTAWSSARSDLLYRRMEPVCVLRNEIFIFQGLSAWWKSGRFPDRNTG